MGLKDMVDGRSLRSRFPAPQSDKAPPDLKRPVQTERGLFASGAVLDLHLEAVEKLESDSGKLVLPYPPSYNRYWRNGHVSAEGLAFKRDAARALLAYDVEKLTGAVVVYLDFYRPRMSGDLDNRIKQTLDCLQGTCYDNDSQIVSIYAHRHEDKENPRVEIRVEEASL